MSDPTDMISMAKTFVNLMAVLDKGYTVGITKGKDSGLYHIGVMEDDGQGGQRLIGQVEGRSLVMSLRLAWLRLMTLSDLTGVPDIPDFDKPHGSIPDSLRGTDELWEHLGTFPNVPAPAPEASDPAIDDFLRSLFP
jgi:hypothetical protein